MPSVLEQLNCNRSNYNDIHWGNFLKKLLHKSKNTNYYGVMGIQAGCKIETKSLEKEYKALCRKLHPDKNRYKCYKDTAEELFKLIRNAYDVLSDPVQEKEYYQQQFGFYKATWRSHHNTFYNTDINRESSCSPWCFSFFNPSMKEQADKETQSKRFGNTQRQNSSLANLSRLFCF